MLKKRDVNMLEGSIVKGLLAIAVPIMVMNVLTSLFNIIDMRMLKAFDTGLSVGAVGVSVLPVPVLPVPPVPVFPAPVLPVPGLIVVSPCS